MPISKIKQASIDASALTGSNISDGTIAAADLATDAVTTVKIADDAITTAKITNDSVTTAKIADTVNLGRRNLVINGRFQFWQRGTSITGNTGAAPFLADRFFVQDSSQFTSNISRDTDVPSGQGFIFSQKREWTTAHNLSNAGSYSLTEHKIERNDINHLMCGTSDAKQVTLSFWVKSSVTGNHSFTMQIFASNRRSYKTTYNIAAANTWEKKTITIQMDTNSAGAPSNAGSQTGIMLRWGHGAGSQYSNGNTDAFETTDTFFVTGSAAPASVANATWYITGIQLEVGDTATPFEFLREGEELALCQRYYQEKQMFHDGASQYLRETIQFMVTMRDAPTGTVFAQSTNGSGTNSSGKIYQASGETTASVSNSTISSARLNSYGYSANIDIYGRVTLDAEL